MCGRYASFLPAEAVARLFHTVNPLPNFSPTWSMALTQDAMVVRPDRERHLDAADQSSRRDRRHLRHVPAFAKRSMPCSCRCVPRVENGSGRVKVQGATIQQASCQQSFAVTPTFGRALRRRSRERS